MILYHGSPIIGLKELKIGTDNNNQGFGIYFTDSIEQAKFFGRYGSIYTVELINPIILDLSNEKIMNEIFSECSLNKVLNSELDCLINGSGNLPNLLNLIPKEFNDLI